MFIPVLALGVLTVGSILMTGRVMAETTSSTKQSFIDRLIQRFNLNKDEVTGVFDEMQQERQQERKAYMEGRFDEAVKDGVITADQKQALLNKHAEMQQKQTQLREEMKTWMEQSGIDFEKLAAYRVGFGGPGFAGPGFGRGHGFWKGL